MKERCLLLLDSYLIRLKRHWLSSTEWTETSTSVNNLCINGFPNNLRSQRVVPSTAVAVSTSSNSGRSEGLKVYLLFKYLVCSASSVASLIASGVLLLDWITKLILLSSLLLGLMMVAVTKYLLGGGETNGSGYVICILVK